VYPVELGLGDEVIEDDGVEPVVVGNKEEDVVD
jgi:hypothetical protein